MSEAIISREFPVSAQRLYDAIADQDKLGSWLGAKVSVPVRGDGGLVGTVRRVHLGPFSFDERIASTESPCSLDYSIVPPMPLLKHHRGEMRIEALGPERSRLQWRVVLELQLGAHHVVLPVLKGVLSVGLGRLAKRLAH
ncbi:MAG: SRPBCC family protein [Polyangiales bacterium]